MHRAFYLPEDPEYTILDSARDAVRFAHLCLEPTETGSWRATSSFVDPSGRPVTWHDFGTLEGPGWAANALGGGLLLYSWGRFDHCHILEHVGLGLIDHVLDDGFLHPDGFIVGYRDTTTDELCLNFKHNNLWFCPGAMARVALQMLWCLDTLPPDDHRRPRLTSAAVSSAEWLVQRVIPAAGWYPRRCDPEGRPYHGAAEGGEDPLSNGSADGMHIIWLLAELTLRGLADHTIEVRRAVDVVLERGGIYGSVNHDTYDADENVGHSIAFRALLRAARLLEDPAIRAFAFDKALPGLERFYIEADRNGVPTQGLLYMEDSWDTAYLWENAEAALAYIEAVEETGSKDYLCDAATILRAIAKHHHGPHGFLTEGVDWNNHVGQQHHIDGAEFGDIMYTEPLLNNLHFIEPAMLYLQRHAP